MLNKEKFKDEIFEIACTGNAIAVTKSGRLLECNDCSCADCAFNNGSNMSCSDMRKEWCNSAYEKSEIDWSKVPLDTPIYIRQGRRWTPRYFAGKCTDDGVYHFNYGKTSFTDEDEYDISFISFTNVKLARTQDIEKYIK